MKQSNLSEWAQHVLAQLQIGEFPLNSKPGKLRVLEDMHEMS